MKIIGGKFKGRQLASIPKTYLNSQLRPTSSRARTVIFDLLTQGREGDLVSGTRVIDLFAGSGCLGLEALSRGANYTLFIDNSSLSGSLINQNISIFWVNSECTYLSMDATRLPYNTGSVFDLMFLDPPYRSNLASISIQSALAGGWINKGSIVVLETSNPSWTQSRLKLITERKVGKAFIEIYVVV